MHIVVMVAAGLALLALVTAGARWVGAAGSSRRVARACGGFVLLWLVVSAVDFYLGFVVAGYSVAAEAAAHAAIFGVPALAAWYLALRASRQDPARPL